MTLNIISLAKVNRVYLALVFCALIALGWSLHSDYGISWDEPEQRLSGLVTLKYLGQYFDIPAIKHSEALAEYHQFHLENYRDRVFGVAFEAPLVMLERIFRLSDEQAIYFFRHFVTYLVYLVGVYAVFQLAKRRFLSVRLGLLAGLFFLLSPRLFAEGFYNTKDIVFLAAFAVAMNSAIGFILKPSFASAIWHAIATAIAIDIRLMAIIFPFITFGFLGFGAAIKQITVFRALFMYVIYGATCALVIVLFWPWLWSAPIDHFWEALLSFSRWVRSDITMLYLGGWVRSIDLPWHYVPVWIAVTTPPLYLVLSFIGVGSTIDEFIRSRQEYCQRESVIQDLFFLAILVGPIFAIIMLHSVVYDGWRHLYFIYPAFLMFSIKGWVCIWSYAKRRVMQKYICIFLLCASLFSTFAWMLKAHPLQNVYFNFLVPSQWKDYFDLDYWGLANRQALEFILQQDSREKIYIRAGSNTPLYHSLKVLKAADRSRIEIVVDEQKADYVVSNFRGKTVDDQILQEQFLPFSQIMVGDQVVAQIWVRSHFSSPSAPKTQKL